MDLIESKTMYFVFAFSTVLSSSYFLIKCLTKPDLWFTSLGKNILLVIQRLIWLDKNKELRKKLGRCFQITHSY